MREVYKKKRKKIKIGTILDEEVFRNLKEQSYKKGIPINEIIQDALAKYKEGNFYDTEMRLAAVKRFCSNPFNLSLKDAEDLLTEDYYEQ